MKLIKTNENGNWQVPVYQNLVELYFVSGITNYDLQKHNRSLSNSEEKKVCKSNCSQFVVFDASKNNET